MVSASGSGPESPAAKPAPDPLPDADRGPGQAAPRRGDPVRRALLLTPVIAILVGVIVAVAGQPADRDFPSPPAASAEVVGSVDGGPSLGGYLVDAAELRERSALAAAGREPYATAVDDLLTWAESAIDESSAPVQPLVIVGTDGPFVQDSRRAYGLALAYVVTGDDRFAAASRATIRAYVDTVSSTTDTCPDSGGCHTSLIIGRTGAAFAFAADLLAGSPVWSDKDAADVRDWMRDVMLPAASRRPNNWGDAGTFLRVVAADHADDELEFAAAIEQWRSFIDLIEPDGRIPEEVRRGAAGISYTHEALQYKVAVAHIAERRGIDLWEYEGALGGSLRAAIDRLAYYWFRPEEWPDHPAATIPSTGPLWEIAFAHWRDPRWVDIIAQRRPFGDRGHSAIRWTTLTNGIPFETVLAGGPSADPSLSPDPSAAPSRSATPAPTLSPAPTAAPAVVIDNLRVRLTSPYGSRLPVTVRWDRLPDDADVEVERAIDGGDWRALTVEADTRSVADTIRLDRTHTYRARAVVDGTAGPWATVEGVSVDRLEGTASSVDRDGPWERSAFSGYSRGVATSTDARDASLTWRGTARDLAIVGPRGPTRGRMIVTVDGERAAVVDLRASGFEPRVTLFEISLPEPGDHTITIEARPLDGRTTVAVDDIVTLDWSASAPGG
jgi:hypothetical protein